MLESGTAISRSAGRVANGATRHADTWELKSNNSVVPLRDEVHHSGGRKNLIPSPLSFLRSCCRCSKAYDLLHLRLCRGTSPHAYGAIVLDKRPAVSIEEKLANPRSKIAISSYRQYLLGIHRSFSQSRLAEL
jgi:hypothetical protein